MYLLQNRRIFYRQFAVVPPRLYGCRSRRRRASPGGIDHETSSTATFRAPLKARCPARHQQRALRRNRQTRQRRTASPPMRRQTASTTRAACVRKGWSTSAISARSRTLEPVGWPVRTAPISSYKAEKISSRCFDVARFCSSVTFAHIFISSISKNGTRLACTSLAHIRMQRNN